jgi:hypothetical protein
MVKNRDMKVQEVPFLITVFIGAYLVFTPPLTNYTYQSGKLEVSEQWPFRCEWTMFIKVKFTFNYSQEVCLCIN